MIGLDILAGIFIIYVIGCMMGVINAVGIKRRTWGPFTGASIQAVVGLTLSVLVAMLL